MDEMHYRELRQQTAQLLHRLEQVELAEDVGELSAALESMATASRYIGRRCAQMSAELIAGPTAPPLEAEMVVLVGG